MDLFLSNVRLTVDKVALVSVIRAMVRWQAGLLSSLSQLHHLHLARELLLNTPLATEVETLEKVWLLVSSTAEDTTGQEYGRHCHGTFLGVSLGSRNFLE